MHALHTALETHPVVYVTRDIERALGLPFGTRGYFIISNFSESVKELTKNHENVLLINDEQILDTHELLSHPATEQFLDSLENPHILVFKNTTQIERICKEKNWSLLNPSASLASTIEEKISQVAWLDELAHLLPPHTIEVCKNITWENIPFILQFNRAHTGSGTMLISTQEELVSLQQKFPERPVRKTAFVHGTMLTSNNVVSHDGVLVGNINVQITGLAPFTDQPFATVGNEWGLTTNILSPALRDEYHKLVLAIGAKMKSHGWKGLFGVDVILDEEHGKLYLIEINARQPASTTYESTLQQKTSSEKTITAFEAHLASLLTISFADHTYIEIKDGAQIIVRNRSGLTLSETEKNNIKQNLESRGYAVTTYANTAPGSDLIRIQSSTSILSSPKTLNEHGETILAILRESITSFAN